MKPMSLQPGDRLDTTIGALVVSADPYLDDHAWPELGLTAVDVEGGSAEANVKDLLATGAAAVLWMSSWPTRRWRLFFKADADVEVTR